VTFKLDIAAPNGRSKQRKITAIDEQGHVVGQDEANLISASERAKVATRLAEKIGRRPADVIEKLDAAYLADEERRRLDEERKHDAAVKAAPGTPPADSDIRLTELGNARRLVRRFGVDLRHCHPWAKDLVYDGRRWALDRTGQVERWAKEVARLICAEAAAELDEDRRKLLMAHALRSEQMKSIRAAAALARSEPGVPILPADLDRDPMLLNVANGSVDLRTGELRPPRREDFCTKLCPVPFDPDATCPLFQHLLGTTFAERVPVIRFVQKLFGYAITGDVREQILPVFWGKGANGKSTLINLFLDLLGEDYAIKGSRDLFLSKKADSHPTQVARLFGKRLVAGVETADGARLDEVLVKELTGGDVLTARRMKEDLWDFRPTHKVILVTNHRPEIRGTDFAIWRRVRLVPFTVQIAPEKQDRELPAKLRKELPGVLAWCVAGCLMWQQEGLEPPEEVCAATDDYRAGQDVLAGFLAECCTIQPDLKVKAGVLYGAYKSWAERSGERPESQRRFGEAMSERGFARHESHGMWYRGLSLRPDEDNRSFESGN
jgi:putative DNA primase/helicase